MESPPWRNRSELPESSCRTRLLFLLSRSVLFLKILRQHWLTRCYLFTCITGWKTVTKKEKKKPTQFNLFQSDGLTKYWWILSGHSSSVTKERESYVVCIETPTNSWGSSHVPAVERSDFILTSVCLPNFLAWYLIFGAILSHNLPSAAMSLQKVGMLT